MKILLIDAYDSFVYIIKNYLDRLNYESEVVRCDKVNPKEIANSYDIVLLGPGPGFPKEANYLDILQATHDKLPIFGICLGMQAIGEFFGASVVKAQSRKHGKLSQIRHHSQGCFDGLKSEFNVVRYHSLVVDKQSITASTDLEITASSLDDHYVMGLKHKFLPIEGIQFHPESIKTENGLELIDNFISQNLR